MITLRGLGRGIGRGILSAFGIGRWPSAPTTFLRLLVSLRNSAADVVLSNHSDNLALAQRAASVGVLDSRRYRVATLDLANSSVQVTDYE